MTPVELSRWLAAYIAAWQSYDPRAIGNLFSADATCKYHPWDEPIRGREAIVKSWIDDQDAPGSWKADYAPFAVQGDAAVATGTSRYFNAEGELEREYHNVFMMRFDADGRCAEFTEWFMQTPVR